MSPSVVELDAKDLTPEGLDYVFFTGSGSEAADTSLKMARAYWRAKGQASKTRLIGREVEPDVAQPILQSQRLLSDEVQ